MRQHRSRRSRIVAGFSAIMAMAGSLAGATSAADMTSKDRAYTLTLMCSAFASEYGDDADKLRTLDAARKVARAQGYSNKRFSHDVLTAASVVGVQIRDDPTRIERNREICRKLKLMS